MHTSVPDNFSLWYESSLLSAHFLIRFARTPLGFILISGIIIFAHQSISMNNLLILTKMNSYQQLTMNSSAADKIRDLFQLTLSELETNIVSQAIKFSQSPQRLVEELQQSVADYKSRFFESLCQLLQFISKDRIQRSDEKKLTAPTQQGLYLPGSEEPVRKILIEPAIKIEQSKQLPIQKQEQPAQADNYYVSSVGKQGSKREVTQLGSKNIIENQIAVASEEKIQEQLLQAEQIEDVELILCPEGCGRQFKSEALEKHVKVCKQVFQQKRAEFNSKQSRIVSQDQQKLIRQAQMKEKQLMKSSKTAPKAPDDPKWKKQSEELRNKIKQQ